MSEYKFTVSGGLPAIPLATVFIDGYMPDANPTFVKVYLYGLRLCYSVGANVDNKKIADALNILESDVMLAWKYWEKQGIVHINKDKSIEFEDLTLVAKKTDKKSEKPSYRAKDMAAAIANNDDMALLLEHTENIFGKTLSPSETSILYGFYDWLKLPSDVILILIEHCANIDKSNLRYIEKIAIDWAEQGIDSMEKAEEYIRSREKKNKISKKYKRILGISGRDLSDGEYVYILQWIEELGMTDELIKAAYEKAVIATGNASFPYINAILQSWKRKDIVSTSDLAKDEKPSSAPIKKGKNKFTSYEQSGEYDIEKLEQRALDKRLGREA